MGAENSGRNGDGDGLGLGFSLSTTKTKQAVADAVPSQGQGQGQGNHWRLLGRQVKKLATRARVENLQQLRKNQRASKRAETEKKNAKREKKRRKRKKNADKGLFHVGLLACFHPSSTTPVSLMLCCSNPSRNAGA